MRYEMSSLKRQKVMKSELRCYFRRPALSEQKTQKLTTRLNLTTGHQQVAQVQTETCFYVQLNEWSEGAESRLQWLLSETFAPEDLTLTSQLNNKSQQVLMEVGPRLSFCTAWSSNASAICASAELGDLVTRIEKSTRYLFTFSSSLSDDDKHNIQTAFLPLICDRMTQQLYTAPLTTFQTFQQPQKLQTIPILQQGKQALQQINNQMGLGFDDWDLDYYTQLFVNKLKRNPTDVECFDMGQSNSEHSRHWFFGGKMVLDGDTKPQTLFQMVKKTLTDQNKANSVIAFHDNSSVIKGNPVQTLRPTCSSSSPCSLASLTSHLLLTAETHNFPSGVAPFPGAETGTGGRIRDVQATGRGAHVVAGISAYAVGNLYLPDYELAWEEQQAAYPSNLATPCNILVEASNGASDYGNKFGEPVICGFARSFGLKLEDGSRQEYIKPIMFSAGLGQLDASHCVKGQPDIGMYVVKIGGPAYRIGMGGGAASSRIQLDNDDKQTELDFNAVQRGDAQMENKMNRVIRACIEMGDNNPIITIHDQGAGGNGNVLKEIVERTDGQRGGGAKYDVNNILVGDKTMSALEIWGAEYQENNALLLSGEESLKLFDEICQREHCPYAMLGQVTGDGRVILYDSKDDPKAEAPIVDLELELVLGKMPQKTFEDSSVKRSLRPVELPVDLTVREAVDRVFRLVQVGSKRFLTNKVDRSVSGLIAQQQTVGPLQLPLANAGVISHSHFAYEEKFSGGMTAVGEQPIKGLLNAEAMARLSCAEALTNSMFCRTGSLSELKCSVNWMWAAKLPGEAVRMYQACEALTTLMKRLQVGIDGGKDSLSMAAAVTNPETKTTEQIKSPGTVVVTLYGKMNDITKKVTPDLKPTTGSSSLYWIQLNGSSKFRLGGSCLAQVFSQVGEQSPDIDDDGSVLANGFKAMQTCLENKWLLAGHDISDGGLITTLCEMAFSGNTGLTIDLIVAEEKNAFKLFFAEEVGLVIQVATECTKQVEKTFADLNVPCLKIGSPSLNLMVELSVNGENVLKELMVELRDVWEATSFELEKKQSHPNCVTQEQASLRLRQTPDWQVSFTPKPTVLTAQKYNVAVLREEGSNGDREMMSAWHTAGFNVWDITMSDLISGKITIDQRFRGIAFVGGFSFADVLGSAKGWAASIKFHQHVQQQLEEFRKRDNTFSLGVCNGCQLMALLGWVGKDDPQDNGGARFLENESGRYESRFVSVRIQKSPAVLLKDMENSTLGTWIAHGEGRAFFPGDGESAFDSVLANDLAPIRYVTDQGDITTSYPFNPNGSPAGIAALCSKNGRHLAMMPHPERSFLKWQWPYMPAHFEELPVSPWLHMFQNAQNFCDSLSN